MSLLKAGQVIMVCGGPKSYSILELSKIILILFKSVYLEQEQKKGLNSITFQLIHLKQNHEGT